MTALTQYDRIETTGRWRPAPGAAPQVVGVSFGDATLTLADAGGRPLAHWSLPAVVRLNPGALPALYAPDAGGTEALELDDDVMTDAIDRVRASVDHGRAPPWRLRAAVAAGLAAAGLLAAALWLPGALRREALAIVPTAERAAIGATLLGHVQAEAGAACRDPGGVDALERLRRRALGEDAPGQAVVLPDGPARPLLLPGDLAVLPRAAVEGASEPAVVAGHLIAAAEAAGGRDLLEPLLDFAGSWATLRLLATGEVRARVLAAYARTLLDAPAPPPAPEALAPAFAAAEVPLAPYAAALGADAGATLGAVLSAAPGADLAAGAPLLLTDAEWVSLQGICRF